jgi:hypothetical protein
LAAESNIRAEFPNTQLKPLIHKHLAYFLRINRRLPARPGGRHLAAM